MYLRIFTILSCTLTWTAFVFLVLLCLTLLNPSFHSRLTDESASFLKIEIILGICAAIVLACGPCAWYSYQKRTFLCVDVYKWFKRQQMINAYIKDALEVGDGNMIDIENAFRDDASASSR